MSLIIFCRFGGNYGGLNKQIKHIDDKYENSQHATKGHKGNQGIFTTRCY